MPFPKYILVSRKLLTEKPVAVNNALRLFHLGVILVASDEDAKLAQTLSENVAVAQKPMVLIADFPEDMRVVNDDGSVEELETNEETTPETPILQLMN
jgi:hypothetical protein